MIQTFASQGTRDIFNGRSTREASKTLPKLLWSAARRKLDQLNQAASLQDMASPPGNRLEKLKGDRREEYSIRVNDQYRVCFQWTPLGPGAVQIVDYHRR